MSRRVAKIPKLELKLNLSPQRENPPVESPDASTTSPTSEFSIEGSCVSSEAEETVQKWPINSEATSMMLVGCPRCLMYVMLSEVDPKCPKCKSTVLLDFLKDEKNHAKNNTNN